MAWNGPVDSVQRGVRRVRGGWKGGGWFREMFPAVFDPRALALLSVRSSISTAPFLSNSVYPCLNARVFCAF